MGKITQEDINKNAEEDLSELLNIYVVSSLVDKSILLLEPGSFEEKITYNGKEYYLCVIIDNARSFVRIQSDDGRQLDINIEKTKYTRYDKEIEYSENAVTYFGIDYLLPKGYKLIYKNSLKGYSDKTNGTFDTPGELKLLLESPNGKQKVLNGFFLPRLITITPEGIKCGEVLVSHDRKRVIRRNDNLNIIQELRDRIAAIIARRNDNEESSQMTSDEFAIAEVNKGIISRERITKYLKGSSFSVGELNAVAKTINKRFYDEEPQER
jgi:hypothetical protein